MLEHANQVLVSMVECALTILITLDAIALICLSVAKDVNKVRSSIRVSLFYSDGKVTSLNLAVLDVGMSVKNGTELSILWQHPDHLAPCFRIAVVSQSIGYSLIRAKAHFSEAQLNLTVNEEGM